MVVVLVAQKLTVCYGASSSYGSTTFNAKFWPSQPVPSFFFYLDKGSTIWYF
jgi:hypothetical protein